MTLDRSSMSVNRERAWPSYPPNHHERIRRKKTSRSGSSQRGAGPWKEDWKKGNGWATDRPRLGARMPASWTGIPAVQPVPPVLCAAANAVGKAACPSHTTRDRQAHSMRFASSGGAVGGRGSARVLRLPAAMAHGPGWNRALQFQATAGASGLGGFSFHRWDSLFLRRFPAGVEPGPPLSNVVG